MTDNLRDRIASLIEAQPWAWMVQNGPQSYDWKLQAADAVIAELGLKHYCRECGGWGPFDE